MLDHIRQQLDDQTIDPMNLQGVGYNYTLNRCFVCFTDGTNPRVISRHDHDVLWAALGEIEQAQGVAFTVIEI